MAAAPDPATDAEHWTTDYSPVLAWARLVGRRRDGPDLVLAYEGAVHDRRGLLSRRHRPSRAVHHGEIRFAALDAIEGVDHSAPLANPDLEADRGRFRIMSLRARPGLASLDMDELTDHDAYPHSFLIACSAVTLTRHLTVGRTLARLLGG